MKLKKTMRKFNDYVLMYIGFFVLSLSLISSKYASQYPLFSLTSTTLYFLSFLILGVYALIWQQVLKRVPLTTAYANRAITIIFGMIWGVVFFAEEISWNMVAGGIIVMSGIILLGVSNE